MKLAIWLESVSTVAHPAHPLPPPLKFVIIEYSNETRLIVQQLMIFNISYGVNVVFEFVGSLVLT